MAYGRTYEGFNEEGHSFRVAVNQSERGYRYHVSGKPAFSNLWTPGFVSDEYPSSQEAREAAQAEFTNKLTTVHKWYSATEEAQR